MPRVFNFSAGPGVVPEECLAQARDEMLDWSGQGHSVIEASHRSERFVALMQETVGLVRELLAVPASHQVLLLQGGAHLQFAMVPLNLLGSRSRADYLDTGVWSQVAIQEARRWCQVNVPASGEAGGYTSAPEQAGLRLDPLAAYVHYCSNETINGIEFPYVPDTGSVPLVADMSSHLMSRPVDVARYGLIYGGAQKNLGPAGLCLVIVREDLLGRCAPTTPTMLDYRTHAEAGSGYNTPPTFSVYFACLVLRWLKRQGGVAAIERRNIEKAQLLYDAIDQSQGFYRNRVRVADRSRMNVPFFLRDDGLQDEFLRGAEANGLVQLRGHRRVGGLRASLYNAMPIEGVRALVSFMRQFAQRHG
ncbi:MAG TPA: 3-phosphoserine/phosphohydroxythreonine transaminase [Burkholderiaceae bacterium]|nr:3-phosphoserine/phosphohydroxythreonine transaminase [Burkholderiaceae bacterium]